MSEPDRPIEFYPRFTSIQGAAEQFTAPFDLSACTATLTLTITQSDDGPTWKALRHPPAPPGQSAAPKGDPS